MVDFAAFDMDIAQLDEQEAQLMPEIDTCLTEKKTRKTVEKKTDWILFSELCIREVESAMLRSKPSLISNAPPRGIQWAR